MSELQACCRELDPLAREMARSYAFCAQLGAHEEQAQLIGMFGSSWIWLLHALEIELLEQVLCAEINP